MAERMRIPSSPACGLWETQLPDAMDGKLMPEEQASFADHMAGCPDCTALFDEARRGREWLEFLAPGPEVPAGLLAKILAQTGPGQVAGYGLIASGGTLAVPQRMPVWPMPGGAAQTWRQAGPRLLMTAAMAFFSIALTLNMAGIRLTSLKLTDLRPTAVRSVMERKLTMASTPIVRYYDHLRLVYEVQSTMREWQHDAEGAGGVNSTDQKLKDGAPGESKTNPGHKSSSIDSMPQEADARMMLQSSSSAEMEMVDVSLGGRRQTGTYRKLLRYGTRTEARERSKVWIA